MEHRDWWGCSRGWFSCDWACRQADSNPIWERERERNGRKSMRKTISWKHSVDLKKQKDEPLSPPRKQTPGFVSFYKYHSSFPLPFSFSRSPLLSSSLLFYLLALSSLLHHFPFFPLTLLSTCLSPSLSFFLIIAFSLRLTLVFITSLPFVFSAVIFLLLNRADYWTTILIWYGPKCVCRKAGVHLNFIESESSISSAC